MSNFTLLASLLSLQLIWPVAAASPVVATPQVTVQLAKDSLYWLNAPLTDAQEQHFTLRDLQGKPQLLTMFYGDCSTACPIVLQNIKQTVAELGADSPKLGVLLISLNHQQDGAAKLAHLVQSHQLTAPQYRLAVSDNEAHTRALATALGIKYRQLDNGEINHNTRLLLLDAQGRLLASSNQLGIAPEPAFLQKIRQVLDLASGNSK